ncbi:MAG: glycosyltransferase family 39 protein [Candidatus Daviesbacteria bacterium]|nr:glycosyltransferase family 39 protein [Candidatus Daviesbacteria bacterium]
MDRINLKIALILGSVFFILGVLTVKDYGTNWDTINHLPRGQAYLHFFMTGKKDYSDLPKWEMYYQNPSSLGIDANIPLSVVKERSIYESDAANFNWFTINMGGGHPPLSDILSSVFNQILFKQLGLINDVDSYRIYGIFLAAFLVGLIFWWVSRFYGKFAGFIAALSLSSYPLFWAESHFNTEKDVPETVFWSFTAFSIWYAVSKRSYKWALIAGAFLGFALGTKFNILFLPFVIAPWLMIYLTQQYLSHKTSIRNFVLLNKKVIAAFLIAPIIGLAIFFASWPYLWSDSLVNFVNVLKFYKEIGTTSNINKAFLGPLGINTYPGLWIIYTTPLIVLFFSFLGIISSIFAIKKSKDKLPILFLLWLAVPIIRVSWPGATIYGGIRQIMEYVPALAILSGIGAGFILNTLGRKSKYQFIISGILILLFVPHLFELVSLHPVENVFFNQIIGGLDKAKEKNIPAWGNSFGGPYRKGVEWINKSAPTGAKVALARELMPNIPRIWFRSDLSVSNSYRSGYLKQGEYVIGLVYEGTKDYSYFDSYLEDFLVPVYEIKVDNVGVLKVWINDAVHAKPGWVEELDVDVTYEELDTGLRFDLGSVRKLSRLEIEYSQDSCQELTAGSTRLSPNGKDWDELVGVYPRYWRIAVLQQQPSNGKFIEPFSGQTDRYIDLVLSPKDTCLRNIKSFKVYSFI